MSEVNRFDWQNLSDDDEEGEGLLNEMDVEEFLSEDKELTGTTLCDLVHGSSSSETLSSAPSLDQAVAQASSSPSPSHPDGDCWGCILAAKNVRAKQLSKAGLPPKPTRFSDRLCKSCKKDEIWIPRRLAVSTEFMFKDSGYSNGSGGTKTLPWGQDGQGHRCYLANAAEKCKVRTLSILIYESPSDVLSVPHSESLPIPQEWIEAECLLLKFDSTTNQLVPARANENQNLGSRKRVRGVDIKAEVEANKTVMGEAATYASKGLKVKGEVKEEVKGEVEDRVKNEVYGPLGMTGEVDILELMARLAAAEARALEAEARIEAMKDEWREGQELREENACLRRENREFRQQANPMPSEFDLNDD